MEAKPPPLNGRNPYRSSCLDASLPAVARECYDCDVATNEAGDHPRTFHPLIRWAAFTGIALLVARRLVYATFPKFLPSSAWPQSSWLAGVLINAAFELILLMFLLGVPFCIYFFKLRTGHTNARDLLIDCAATVILYLAALFLL
jgi:hypothetical protein